MTHLKLTETYRETGREILQILNEPGNMENCIRRVLAEVKARIGFDAVGIRLQDGEDFPYFVQEGFSNDFLLTENTLIERNANGEACRNPDGSVRLECTCGLVISGKTDPANPLFTRGGSFWTNDSFPLLNLSPDDDPRINPRNQCMHHGYASMALVPVRNKDRIVGLIQLNDRRKGRFSLESVELMEGIALHIGGALMRKQAEEAHRESEERLRTLINATPDIVCFKDGEGRWLEANQADLELFGLTGVDYRGKTDSELAGFSDFYREDFLIREATDERTWQAHTTTRYDKTIPLPDGTVKVFDVIKVPLFHGDGKRRGMVVLGRDITERKRVESELRMFRETVDNSSNVIGLSTPEGKHFYQNAAFDDLFGTIGDNPPSVYVDETVADEIFKTIKAGGRWDGEVKMVAKDGSVRDILIRAYANKDSNGRVTALVGLHTDITERKRAEEEKTKLEAQFHQAQKMESVGRLAGGVAHDFNNMLSVILGFTELAMAKADPSQSLLVDLAEVRKAANRSADLTRQLLAFARKQTIAPKVIDLNETVAGMIKMLRQLIGEDIDLIWEPGANLWPVKVDPSQLDQILANLCVNARDAIHDVGKITIETKNVALDKAFCAEKPGCILGEYLRLAVSDTGKGIDKETLGQIFEPFFTTKTMGKGTGLGLATVYGIVKQNNGFIDVYSEPGQGTTFTIYLPRHELKAGQMQKESPAEQAERGHETILLVENEPAILEMATQMLEMHGYM
ncbi:MAG: PAS domain S-box protein [Desulfosalsimonadaceae bacterium]